MDSAPLDLLLHTKNEDFPANSQLLSQASDVLSDLIRAECIEKNSQELTIDIPGNFLSMILEFVHTAQVKDLWKVPESDIIKLLRYAKLWHIEPLAILCQQSLKRYITEDNVWDTLKMAHQNEWEVLEERCCILINEMNKGVVLSNLPLKNAEIFQRKILSLSCEFLEFTETSFDVFEHFREIITQIVCRGSLSIDPRFGMAVKSCPRLVSVDLHGSLNFSDYFFDIPGNLLALDISSCTWVDDRFLQRMVQHFSRLMRLTMNSSSAVSYKGWVDLQKLKTLSSLDISRCTIADESFSLLVKACGSLVELDIEDCGALSEKSFFELARYLNVLEHLNVARCHISDAACLDIAARCTYLRSLNLSRCGLSSKGITQLVRLAPRLEEINVEGCHLSEVVIESLREMRPYLKIRD